MPETARKSGRLGSLWMSAADDTIANLVIGMKVADLFEWQFEVTANMETVSVKGDAYDRNRPNGVSSRFTARAYIQTTAALLNRFAGSAKEEPDRYAFKLWAIDNTGAQQAYSGYCWLSRGSLNVPRGMIVDDCEFTVDGEFTPAP